MRRRHLHVLVLCSSAPRRREPIMFERLLIFPEAPNCADCAGR